MIFEWDEAKRMANLAKHGLDFDRAREIWRGRFLDPYAVNTEHGETRFLAIGTYGG